MTTTGKLWLGFGTLIGILVLIVVPVWIWLHALQERVNLLASVAGPMNEAVHELEINVNGMGVSVANYLHLGEPVQQQRFEDDVGEFMHYKSEYDRMATTGRQRELGREIADLFAEYRTLGEGLIRRQDRGDPIQSDLRRFIDLRIQLDDILDDEVQIHTRGEVSDHRKFALANFRTILATLGSLLVLGMLIALTSSFLVGRGIVKAEETLRITLTSIGDAVISTDDEGRVVSMNPVAESLTGWNNSEARGKPLIEVFNIINEQSRQSIENPVTKVLQDGQVVGLANHTILIAKDGMERSIDDSAAPIHNVTGNVIGVVLIFRDITERRIAERSMLENQTRQSAMLNTALDGIITIDHLGMILEFNPAAEQMFGYSRDEMLGREMAEFIIPRALRESHRKGIARFRATGEGPLLNQRLELSAIRSGGDEFPVELAITCIRHGKSPLFTGYIRDITDRKRSESELRESEARRRMALEAAELGAWNIDPVAGVLTSDERFRILFHGSTDPITYEETFTAIHSDDRQRIREAVAAATRPDDPVPYAEEYRVVHPSGAIRWVYGKGRANFENVEAGQRLVSFNGTVMDVTDRKRLQDALREHEQRFRTLVEQVEGYAIFMTDAQGQATSWNEGVLKVLGFEEDEFIGQDIVPAIFRPEDVESGVAMAELEMAAATGSASDDRWMMRKDGSQFWAAGVTTGLHDDDGKLLGFMKVMRDQTERKRMEDELRQFAAELSEADRRKTEFLATLGHELRNPLAPIRTGLEAMKLAENDPETLAEIRNTMERQLQQMVRLIDDLLDVSRITRGKMELRTCRVALKDVIESAVEATRPLIDEAGHELTVSMPPSAIYLNADPNRLAQVFSNLLNNATRYTPNGGHVQLTIEQQGNIVLAAVKDDGLGIPPEMLDEIFEMFTQIDHPSQQGNSGLGIGLTLVKQLVGLHHGSIEVRSDGPGKGSEFNVRLPILIDSSDAEFTRDEPVAEATSIRVLVVDDNEAAATMLKMYIAMIGNEARTAYDGMEAIQVAAAFRPEIVLMDLGMPRMNGYEAARHIREQPWGRDMVLVALTGWGQDDDRERTQEAGFDYHLVKPAEPAAIQQLLASFKRRSSVSP